MQGIFGVIFNLILLIFQKWLETNKEKKETKKQTLQEVDNALKKRDWSEIAIILDNHRNNNK